MKVVLVQAVPGVGQPGQVKDVADGYARNYLIPRGLAVPATPAAVKQAEARRAAEERRQARAAEELRELAQRIEGLTLTLRAKAGAAREGEERRLYGSITAADVAEALSKALGATVDKRHVELEEPIRTLGSHRVTIRLGHGLAPRVTVAVEPEEA
ncbi:MAG TPA: 50S ribosomal protein L9 [Chloroflexota bacterium]